MDASLYAVLFGAVGEAPTPYPLRKIQRVADDFESIFGVKFSKFRDKTLTAVFRVAVIDVFAFDDWPHEKYGKYEDGGESTRDIVTEHYGEKGAKMILNLIG